ncbi:MAG: hypothetical protein RMK31_07815 [Candidatus Caldarchaeum sp.]|nr:hypothetical protein [Candidatus Caldarchaeum sp.]MDW8360468.1 hypothetical protein [Candidatus Caldarchaeum sp.]
MRLAEVLGSLAALILAFVLFSALAGSSPAFIFWDGSVERLVPSEPDALWRGVTSYLYGGLFPAFLAFGLVLLTLVVGLSAMLRGEE